MVDSESEQGTYMMNLDHLVMPESKDGLQKQNDEVNKKGSRKQLERTSSGQS